MSNTDDKNTQVKSQKPRGSNWDEDEEKQLAKSWMLVSQQAEYATNQTSDTFFNLVTEDFLKYQTKNSRTMDQIRGRYVVLELPLFHVAHHKLLFDGLGYRWAVLQTATMKFSAYYAKCDDQRQSGCEPGDIL